MNLIDADLSPTGLLTRVYADDDTGEMHVDYKQDIEKSVEFATQVRNDPEHWRAGVKAGWVMAAHIPDIAIVKLRGIGVDIFSSDTKAADLLAGLRKLGMDHLITTTKRV